MKTLIALLFLMTPALAAPKPHVTQLDPAALSSIIADLTYADALAHATGNKITAPCWDSLLVFIGAWNKVLKDANGNDLPVPNPNVITTAERISEIINSLQPDSEVSLACAAMVQASQKTVANIIGAVLTGGALFTLPLPVIP